MKFQNRPVLALTNLDNALTHKASSWWPTILLVVLFSWLCSSSEAQAATRDRKKPTVPTGLTATAISCSQIDLSWTASTDTGGSGLVGYKIYRDGVLLKQVLAPATQTSDAGLAGSRTYSYSILAFDKAGNKSAKSAAVLTTTPACCSYSISPAGASVGAEGGSGTIVVTTGSACIWSATSTAGWLTVNPGGTSTGTGSLGWTATVNSSTNSRAGLVTVGGQVFTVTQAGAPPTLVGVPLGEALDNTTLNWTTGGNANWLGQTIIAYNGDAAQAGAISNSQSSWLETTVTGPVDFSFMWKVSSELNYDFLRFSIDGMDQASVSGEVDWQPRTFSIPSGTHTLRWAYAKDGIISAGMDCGWVDQIQVTLPAVCNYTVTLFNASFGASGGVGSASVTTASGCNWSAGSAYSWIHTTSSGSGSGTATFSVDANTSTSSRSGTLDIAGYSFTVMQAGAVLPCTYAVSPSSASFPASGGSGSASVAVSSSTCTWTAGTTYNWIHLAATSGVGSGALDYTVDANPCGNLRSGTITVQGQTHTVNQAAATCSYANSQSSTTMAAAGGNGSVNVTANCDCSWLATVDASGSGWISITSGASGNGNGAVYFSVSANSSTSQRIGTLTIAGRTFTVTEAGVTPACTYAVTPSSPVLPALSGPGSASVTASASTCAWTAGTTYNWIHITNPNGVGTSTLNYTVDANPCASARAGTITVQGQIHTVNQGAATCSYALAQSSTTMAESGGNGSVNVTGTCGCGWLATVDGSGSGWISITSGNSGNGNGAVYYAVSANTSTSQRIGTMTIAGRTFTVTQAGAAVTCTYSLSPASASPPATASSGSFNVFTTCPWTPVSSAPGWLTCSPPNGAGNGAVTWYAAANTSTSPRTGYLTISNQTFTVTQAGVVATNQLQWVCSGTGGLTTSSGTVVDHSGNVIVVGQFQGTVDFGSSRISSVGSTDAFIAKYTSQGTLLWVKRLGGSMPETAAAVAIDSQNNIIVAGSFFAAMDAGGGPLTSIGDSDVFVAKYSPSGVHIWSRSYGWLGSDSALAMGVDASGNVFVSSKSGGTADFGGGTVLTTHGGSDITLVKLSGVAGATMWATMRGSTMSDWAYGLAVDGSGDVVLTGRLSAPGDLGAAPLPGSATSGMFVAKYSGTDGSCRWARIPGGINDGAGYGIACDPNTGKVICTGKYTSDANFGGGSLGTGGIFLAAYDPAGNFLWANSYGDPGDSGGAVAVEANGYITLTGTTRGFLNFGGGWLGGNGNANAFVATLSTSGSSGPVYRWAKRIGGESYGTGIAFDSLGHVVTTGYFRGGADFGGTTLTAPVGGTDAFVGQYNK